MSFGGRQKCHSAAVEHGTGGRFRWQTAYMDKIIFQLLVS